MRINIRKGNLTSAAGLGGARGLLTITTTNLFSEMLYLLNGVSLSKILPRMESVQKVS